MAFQLPSTETPRVISTSPLTPEERRLEEERLGKLQAGAKRAQGERTQESLSKDIASNMRRWHADPWAMVEDGVIWTLDPTHLQQPVRQFPPDPWLEHIVRQWEAERLLLVPKSRRMMITWLMIYIHLWLAMWHPGVACFFVSQSERKSAEMIQKAEFIYRHIPETVMLKPKIKTKQCLLEFPGLDSYIMGIPEGENQLRQYTATALVFDEWAFWERPMESLSAAKPCITGGGRLSIVSTPGDEAFYNLAFDQRM